MSASFVASLPAIDPDVSICFVICGLTSVVLFFTSSRRPGPSASHLPMRPIPRLFIYLNIV